MYSSLKNYNLSVYDCTTSFKISSLEKFIPRRWYLGLVGVARTSLVEPLISVDFRSPRVQIPPPLPGFLVSGVLSWVTLIVQSGAFLGERTLS